MITLLLYALLILVNDANDCKFSKSKPFGKPEDVESCTTIEDFVVADGLDASAFILPSIIINSGCIYLKDVNLGNLTLELPSPEYLRETCADGTKSLISSQHLCGKEVLLAWKKFVPNILTDSPLLDKQKCATITCSAIDFKNERFGDFCAQVNGDLHLAGHTVQRIQSTLSNLREVNGKMHVMGAKKLNLKKLTKLERLIIEGGLDSIQLNKTAKYEIEIFPRTYEKVRRAIDKNKYNSSLVKNGTFLEFLADNKRTEDFLSLGRTKTAFEWFEYSACSVKLSGPLSREELAPLFNCEKFYGDLFIESDEDLPNLAISEVTGCVKIIYAKSLTFLWNLQKSGRCILDNKNVSQRIGSYIPEKELNRLATAFNMPREEVSAMGPCVDIAIGLAIIALMIVFFAAVTYFIVWWMNKQHYDLRWFWL